MNRSMTPAERAARDVALADERRALRRLIARGPMDDPLLERQFTGTSHVEKVSAQVERVQKLAILT